MDKEGDVIRTEFLDKKVREKVVVACEVMHVHHFGGTPFGSDRFLVTRGGGGDRHQGRLWERDKRRRRGGEAIKGILFFLYCGRDALPKSKGEETKETKGARDSWGE